MNQYILKEELDIEKVKNDCVEWIRDFFEKNGKGCNAVVGISGGKDSSVTAALLVEALGKDRLIGVLMPNGEQSDIEYARLLVDTLGIRNYTININYETDKDQPPCKNQNVYIICRITEQ